jgi:hypothetical protein
MNATMVASGTKVVPLWFTRFRRSNWRKSVNPKPTHDAFLMKRSWPNSLRSAFCARRVGLPRRWRGVAP